MSRRTKLITALLSFIFCLSLFTVTVFAVDPESSDIIDDPIYTEAPDPIYTDPVPVETEPPYVEPVTEPPYVEPVTEAPYYEPETTPDYNSSQLDYDSDNGGESSEFYVGGGQSYVPPLSTAPSAALYDSDRKIDDSVLSNNDWKDIAANLSNASDSGDGSDDFSFIKNNDSMGDNGDWMLYTGIACLALSAAGIAYFIFSTVNRHKKVPSRSGKQYAYAGSGGRYRSGNDYGDGFRESESKQKKINKSRKYDTADVTLPKSSSGLHYKNGGKRYK